MCWAGAPWRSCATTEGLDRYVTTAVQVSRRQPGLDRPVPEPRHRGRTWDAVCDGHDVWIAGVMEHIEEAGVHSGDSACSLPPFSLRAETVAEAQAADRGDGAGLERPGTDERAGSPSRSRSSAEPRIYVLEVNPRASRTVPFVAKAIGLPVAAIAAKVMAGSRLAEFELKPSTDDHVAVKEAVFPFARFPGVDTVLGPEMRSTGEVMGLDWRRPRRARVGRLRPRLRKGPAGRRHDAAGLRRCVRLGQAGGQAVHPGARPHPQPARLPPWSAPPAPPPTWRARASRSSA